MAAGRGVYGDRPGVLGWVLTDRCFLCGAAAIAANLLSPRADGDLRRDGVGNGFYYADWILATAYLATSPGGSIRLPRSRQEAVPRYGAHHGNANPTAVLSICQSRASSVARFIYQPMRPNNLCS